MLEARGERRDLLVGAHVLQRQRDLTRGLAEELGVGLRVLARVHAGHRERADGGAPGDERHDRIGADTVGASALLHRVLALAGQVLAHDRLLAPEHPPDVAVVRGHLQTDGEVRRGQRGLEHVEPEHLSRGVVEEDRGPVERDDAAQRLGDRVEERVAGQARDDRVVDLEQRTVARGVGRRRVGRAPRVHESQRSRRLMANAVSRLRARYSMSTGFVT